MCQEEAGSVSLPLGGWGGHLGVISVEGSKPWRRCSVCMLSEKNRSALNVSGRDAPSTCHT